MTEVYKNKAEAVQAAEEASLEKIREGWRVRLIPLYSRITVDYENLEQGCKSTLHFPFRSLDQGDLCEVWNSDSAKCALMVFTGEYDSISGYPLFSVRLDWKIPSSWKHYRRTGYNAVNRTFQPTEEISFR